MAKKHLLFISVFLAFLFSVPMVAQAAWQPSLTIGLMENQSDVLIKISSGHAICQTEEKSIKKLTPNSNLVVSVKNQTLALDGKSVRGKNLEILPESSKISDLQVSINGKPYHGRVKIILRGSTFTVINEIQTEDYLKGVISKEMPEGWPLEAQKAQAIAARTFALKNRKRHQSEGFDLCTSTHCQTYAGIAGETSAGNQAVNDTYGEVLEYQGKLIDAVFHTDSGGMTENSENVWETKIPYLRAAREKRTRTQPWEKKWDISSFSSKINFPARLGALKKVSLSPLTIGKSADDRGASGRVKQVNFIGAKGQITLSGNQLRSLLGLNSTLFDIKLDKNTVTITGYGMGHGLGLSQWGARDWAAAGEDDAKILARYYANSQIKKLY